MASVSSLGIGTGVDLQNMLSKILAAERTPITRLDSQITATKSKISLYGTLNSKLDTLKSAADTWQFPSRLSAVSASSSDTSVLAATASYTASVGSYAMEVTQLASSQKSFSNSYAAGTTFGAGELKFTVGAEPEATVTIADGATLSDVSASINSAKIGVTATVVTTSDGSQRMILTGDKSGSGNDFTLTSSTATPSGGSSLADFDEVTAGLARSVAQDAKMTIDGIEVASSTNIFTSAIEGLTVTATKLGTSNVAIQNDKAKITSAAQAFVDGYNALATLVKSNSGYDTATKTGQAFNGDVASRSVLSTLGTIRTTTPSDLSSANLKALSEIGIVIQQTGQLTLDSAKLEQAINDSPNDVTNLLKAYGKEFSNAITSMQSSGGVVANRLESLNGSISRFNLSKEGLEERVALVEKRYRAQFTALDKYVNSMQTTSSYLGQQLAQFA